jgi:iron complex outermembrane receptor protein
MVTLNGRAAWLAGLGMAIALPAAPSFAQESPQAVEDEITVTATRREQSLAEVPFSVTALSAESLENSGIAETRDLQFVTPGLTWGSVGPISQPTIRGIGTSSTQTGDSANVAIYVDGVYNPSAYTGIFEFANIDRIEVLKGPQGTLFGRNATGGAILIHSRDPDYEPSLRASVTGGDYGLIQSNGYATTGLTDTLAADFAFYYTADDGYARDIVSGADIAQRDSYGLRTRWMFEPTNRAQIIFGADYQDYSDSAGYATQAINGNLAGLNPGATGPTDPNTPQPTGPYQGANSVTPAFGFEAWTVNLNSEFKFDSVTLGTVTAYTDQNFLAVADGDGTVLPRLSFTVPGDNQVFQQEITLASAGESRLDWIFGAFYLNDVNHKGPGYALVVNGANAPRPNEATSTRAWALFGEATYNLSDQLSLTGGLRYSDEERRVQTGGAAMRGSWDDLSARASLLYEVTDTTNFYATYSQGFKSGTFDAGNTIAPETVDAYEVGIKSSPTNNLSFEASAFYYDYTDIQIQAYVGSSTTVTQLQNAATAEIYGLELDMRAHLTDNFSARIGAAYTHSEYGEFIGATVFDPIPGGGNTQLPRDVSGNQMVRSPEWTVSLGLDYETTIADGRFLASTNIFLSDSFQWDVDNRLQQEAYEMINAKVSWTTPDERLRFSIWGENLTDELVGLWVGESTQGDRVAWGRPRWFGATVEFMLN